MSAVGLESIEHAVQITHVWINELDERLGWSNKPRTYRLLKAVLRSLRDWLQHDEAANLAAQLPELLRGAYYEHWRPSTTPVKERARADFLARIDNEFRRDPLIATDESVAIVFDFLSGKISPGEIADVRQSLPADLRALWPARSTERVR